tara:strand:- start:1634 stop:2329 length:696 start_codon:yes stop_codon:yes gene_type:complete
MDSLFEYFMWGIVGLILVIVAWRWLLLIIALALTINGIQSHPYITAIVWGLFIVMGIAGYIWEKAELENQKKAKKKARKEAAMKMQREMDQDVHSRPYEYKTGRHANETLAIRYGIANLEKKTKEYWYYARGGERKRNPDRDRIYYAPAETIKVQKTKRLKDDQYEVLLTDFRNRKAKAIIEPGTDYVKTFYPMSEDWFDKYANLETVLKGNSSFSLKELATFHVQKVIGS